MLIIILAWAKANNNHVPHISSECLLCTLLGVDVVKSAPQTSVNSPTWPIRISTAGTYMVPIITSNVSLVDHLWTFLPTIYALPVSLKPSLKKVFQKYAVGLPERKAVKAVS